LKNPEGAVIIAVHQWKERRVATPWQFAQLTGLMLGLSALAPNTAQAQWWTATPADFEECAERAERSATKDKATLLSACDGQFAGRRKAGGGYTYYDFMQNRSFDIAGPNPTAAEQKAIDEHYTSYLDQHRRSAIAAAFAQSSASSSRRRCSRRRLRRRPCRQRFSSRLPCPGQGRASSSRSAPTRSPAAGRSCRPA
jgi:hypothetical protein